jgi:hypothetical protein
MSEVGPSSIWSGGMPSPSITCTFRMAPLDTGGTIGTIVRSLCACSSMRPSCTQADQRRRCYDARSGMSPASSPLRTSPTCRLEAPPGLLGRRASFTGTNISIDYNHHVCNLRRIAKDLCDRIYNIGWICVPNFCHQQNKRENIISISIETTENISVIIWRDIYRPSTIGYMWLVSTESFFYNLRHQPMCKLPGFRSKVSDTRRIVMRLQILNRGFGQCVNERRSFEIEFLHRSALRKDPFHEG